MMNECTFECREITLLEEIENLPIEESVKDRIHQKAMRLYEENKEMNQYLCRCHNRIHWLEKACTELAVLVAKQKDGVE